MSQSSPSVSSIILLYIATASVASRWKYSSARSSFLARSSDFCEPPQQITLPVTPALFFASYRQSSPDFPPPPITRTVFPGLTSFAVCAGAPATSSAERARPSGISSGSLAYIPLWNKIACPLMSTWSISGLTAKISSITSGVSESETRVAILSPTFRSPT